MLRLARKFARQSHGDQVYGEGPFSMMVHLDAVVGVLQIEAGYTETSDRDVLCAGYLHDVLEDTAIPGEEIERLFGEDVLRIVRFCTDPPGPNRATRKAALVEALKVAPARDLDVKVSDRICNIRASVAAGDLRRVDLYVRETSQMIEVLPSLLQCRLYPVLVRAVDQARAFADAMRASEAALKR